MVNAMKDGKLTKEEDETAQKLIGSKVSTTYTDTASYSGIKLTTTTTTIGKVDIGVETKLTQQKKASNQVGSEINVTTITHYSAYIFYLPEWKRDMEDDRKKLASLYGISEDDIGTASVTSAGELKNNWNSMGKSDGNKDISAVIINTHANKNELSFGNGNKMTSSNISGLNNKSIDNLILYGCNAGHLDHKTSNPAANFSKKVNEGLVMASDGTVYGGKIRMSKILWFEYESGYEYESRDDKSFRNQQTSVSKRDNKGWIIYQYTSGKVTTSDSLGKKLTLDEMLFIMK